MPDATHKVNYICGKNHGTDIVFGDDELIPCTLKHFVVYNGSLIVFNSSDKSKGYLFPECESCEKSAKAITFVEDKETGVTKGYLVLLCKLQKNSR